MCDASPLQELRALLKAMDKAETQEKKKETKEKRHTRIFKTSKR